MLHDLTLSLSVDAPIFERIAQAAPGPFASGHVGTHADTPLQKRPIPLEWMVRQGVLVDVRAHGTEIGMAALSEVKIQPGDFVIFHTGHMAAHDYGTAAYFADHPQLDWAIVEFLVARQVSFMGIDAPALRRGRDEHFKVDCYCEEHHTYVVENLTNLEGLAVTNQCRFPLRLGWLGHRGMTGIAMRVVAETAD